jgi:O-antigen/teichoic acid export membrane protein
VVLRNDVLGAIDSAYAAESGFVVLLLLVALVNCSFGLAGNALVFSGRTKLVLANNVFVAALNSALNLLWIPKWGLLGAAGASLVSGVVIVAIQLVELQALEGIRWRWRSVAKPYAGLLLGSAAIWLLWDPGYVGPGDWPLRAAVALALVVGFSLTMLALRHEEYVELARRAGLLAPRRAAPAESADR